MDILQLPRGGGKTTRLIAAIRDELRIRPNDPVIAITHAGDNHLERQLNKAGISNRRCRVFTEKHLLRGDIRGYIGARIFCDNVDLWQDGALTHDLQYYEVRLVTSSEAQQGTLEWLDDIERQAERERLEEARRARREAELRRKYRDHLHYLRMIAYIYEAKEASYLAELDEQMDEDPWYHQ